MILVYYYSISNYIDIQYVYIKSIKSYIYTRILEYDHYISPDISMLTHIHYQIENIPIGNIKRLSLGNYWNIIWNNIGIVIIIGNMIWILSLIFQRLHYPSVSILSPFVQTTLWLFNWYNITVGYGKRPIYRWWTWWLTVTTFQIWWFSTNRNRKLITRW